MRNGPGIYDLFSSFEVPPEIGSREADWCKARTKSLIAEQQAMTFLKIRTRLMLKRLVLVWLPVWLAFISKQELNAIRRLRRFSFEKEQ